MRGSSAGQSRLETVKAFSCYFHESGNNVHRQSGLDQGAIATKNMPVAVTAKQSVNLQASPLSG